jgi:hypothetical protein
MATKTEKTLEIIVTGQIDVSVPLELPANKAKLKKLALNLGLTAEASIQDIAKAFILDAVRSGFDDMEYRQSDGSDVSERDLEIEIQ